MKKTAILIMVATIISKSVGFVREMVLSYYYGTSGVSDAYLISLTIPAVIFGFVSMGISTGYIPMYSKIERDYGTNDGIRYTNKLITLLIIISTLVVIIGLMFTDVIVSVFASGFTGETLELAINFTRISILIVYFTGLTSVYTSFLQVKGSYVIPALIYLPMNIFIITSIVISSTNNVLILTFGTVVAYASQLVFLMPFLHKKGYKYIPSFNMNDKHIKRMLYLAIPVILGVSVNQINVLVDRTLASQIMVGGVSALNYANVLNGFVQGMFIVPIATAMYPLISKSAAENNMVALKGTLKESIIGVNLLVLPATMGLLFFSEPIVSFLFGRGAFDSKSISLTSYALYFYSIGMIGFGLREVLSRAFYSLQDTKTPMVNAAISMVLNIILSLILSRYMGIGGLALGTSISAIICTGMLVYSLKKKIGQLSLKQILFSTCKILFASLVMGFLAKFTFIKLNIVLIEDLSLIVSILLGTFVYFVLLIFLNIEEVSDVTNKIKKRIKSKSSI